MKNILIMQIFCLDLADNYERLFKLLSIKWLSVKG